MKLIEKIAQKNSDIYGSPSVTIAFLGDSVTQGCFECYFDEKGVETVFDAKSGYAQRVKEILNFLYPKAQINIINSGISGDNAPNGNERFERDIAPYHPDLVVVSFGLNDSTKGMDKIENYTTALTSIFEKTKKLGAECIFLFPNTLNTKTSPHLKEDRERELAERFANIQNRGDVSVYRTKGIETARACGVKTCDLYSVWEKMANSGVDTTELLANKYNHPRRELHYYMAMKIVEIILEIEKN